MLPFLLGLVLALVGCATRHGGEAVGATATSPASAEQGPPTSGPRAEPAPLEDKSLQAGRYFDSGQALLARGQGAAAVGALRQALRADPEMVEARISLGRALYDLGDFDGAIDELHAVLRRQPASAPARLQLARALMARQDWARARTELDAALKIRPDQAETYYSLGIVLYALGDWNGAIEAYHRVIALNPDQSQARYNLALMLKLGHRDIEAAREFIAAAEGGVPKAQYFAGAAYAAGLGVEPSLKRAITWWFRASEQGVEQADEALAELRQVSLGRTRRSPAERASAEQAFRDFRTGLWDQFPGLARDGQDSTAPDGESVGAALLRAGRVDEGVPVLIVEALALSDPAQRMLETVYEQGLGAQLAPYDPRIFAYFNAASAEGQPRARVELARIYAHGLGVPANVDRAIALLRATPHDDARRLLEELSGSGRPTSSRP
jgi:tetratricopeptide (TPR) repeat protein